MGYLGKRVLMKDRGSKPVGTSDLLQEDRGEEESLDQERSVLHCPGSATDFPRDPFGCRFLLEFCGGVCSLSILF
jgi:hypothetical protein